MITDTLLQFGFDGSDADVYTALQQGGEQSVPQLQEKTGYSRQAIYETLNFLLAQGYIAYRKEGRNSYYKAEHPDKLAGLIEEKKRESTRLSIEMEQVIRDMTGMFNAHENKPGVRFFEGKDGLIDAYNRLLDIGKPIDSIEDTGDMMNFFPEYVKEYVKKRVGKKIPNRAIAPSANKLNDPDPSKLLDSRLIPTDQFPFTMDIKICADTVHIATLKEGQAVAVQITHPIIAENFRVLFDYIWCKAPAPKQKPPEAKGGADSSGRTGQPGGPTSVFNN